VSDATVKQALLEMRADADAAKLSELTAARKKLEEQQAHELEVRGEADKARTNAEAALADVIAASDQQTKFILEVEEWLANPDGALKLAAASPEEAARIQTMTNDLNSKIAEIEQAEQAEEARQAAEEARRRVLEGGFSCPVDGAMNFTDTWGDPRPGGRVHKGTDMMAATGTPVVAPVDGRLVHKGDSIGGMSFFVYGDDGHEYFGTHLSKYENQGAGWVKAGTLIGRVGSTGNASSPHLHFSYYPNGGSPVNPYTRLNEVCPHT
jgi:murein DD-endopeptidase MepM/ murein hydrolase activator NlpD